MGWVRRTPPHVGPAAAARLTQGCAATPPTTSPLELGSALVAAAWLAGFAVVANLVSRRTRGDGDGQ
jgi:hypothetical protein